MFAAVILSCKKRLDVPLDRCQRINKDFAYIFHTKDKTAVPDFSTVHNDFNMSEDRAYYGFILLEFGEFCVLASILQTNISILND